MQISTETLDDVLQQLYPPLLASDQIVETSRGSTRELVGVLFQITKPRARLSRSETRGKPFSCLGELCWYLAGDNTLEFITHYITRYAEESEDGETVYGAYGPRLFRHHGTDQIDNVTRLLRDKPTTRRAVIQLFDAKDISIPHKEVPCTTTLQFLLRQDKVDLIVTMRSNDAYKGLPHDVFCFTMLQEIIARSVGAELGTYRHFVGSMHIYEHQDETKNDVAKVELYLGEGIQPRIEMPAMPIGDPWPALKIMRAVEPQIRAGGAIDVSALGLDPYWVDLLRLLQVFAARGDDAQIDTLKSALAFKKYGTYIEARKGMAARRARTRSASAERR